MNFTEIFSVLQSQRDLTSDQMHSVIEWFLSGKASQEQIIEFLGALADKGESVAELVGAATALREGMRKINTSRGPVADTCGTGGDGSKTFNISTAAALAAAASGCVVAKHGNRKVTSQTGSADVLSELGINLEASPETVEQCLDQLGICFCFAPFFHPAMRHVGPARQQLGRPSIFNRLGPLANPAGAECQVLGVGDRSLQDKLASALQKLGTKHSVVVNGDDGVDELSISAPTRILEVSPESIRELTWTPEDFGCETGSRDDLFANDPASSAECIREVFSGKKDAKREVVVLNAAAAVWLAEESLSPKDAADKVRHAIDSGKAQELTDQLAKMTQG